MKARCSVLVNTGPGAHTASCKMNTGSLSWGKVIEEYDVGEISFFEISQLETVCF